jgi:hypothetical protein
MILIEVDFEKVNRCRQRGLKGLGQPLKSYRDNSKPFSEDLHDYEYLDSLGELVVPTKNTTN